MDSATLKTIRDFCQANAITRGLKQEEQTAMACYLLMETVFTDCTQEQYAQMYATLYPLMNASALRQKLENAGILAKSEGAKRGTDATAVAAKWAAKLTQPSPAPSTPVTPSASPEQPPAQSSATQSAINSLLDIKP